jgi:hypothetical protein
MSGNECTTSYFELPPASPGAQPLAARLREMAEALGLVHQPTLTFATSTASLNKIDDEDGPSDIRRRTQSQREEGNVSEEAPKKSKSSENLEQATRSSTPK